MPRLPWRRQPQNENSHSVQIKNCEKMAKSKVKYCFGCGSFTCDRLNNLDKRYRTKYGMSMIENLENIRKLGIRHFIRNEKIGGNALDAVSCSVFINRNVFIASIRGVRTRSKDFQAASKTSAG